VEDIKYEQISKKENALIKCMLLTFLAMIFEIYYGLMANCLVLISDGIHMLSHVFSLLVSFFGFYLYRKTNSTKYGVWAAKLNAVSLILFSIPLLMESFNRFSNPKEINIFYSFIIGFIGLIVNLICAFLLNRTGVEDLNSKSAYLHMIGDLMTSFSVILGVGIVYVFHLTLIDPFLTIVLCFLMIYWGYDLAKKTIKTKSLVV